MTDVALAAALAYAALLFLIAFICERMRKTSWLASPIVYTLSISVYCTSWTFYGAVGSAARNGLEYLTIYLGPTLVFLGFWTVLRKLLRISKRDNITSVADFISARYGKSDSVAAIVTVIAVCAAAPYIALQIKAIAASFEVISAGAESINGPALETDTRASFWITVGLAVFTIFFGTRTVDVNERHFGVVAAIAVEALVKLIALIAVGLLAIFVVADGPTDVFSQIAERLPEHEDTYGARWVGLTLLSGIAIICLPRQFQVTMVENAREDHLLTAAWLFPLYLLLMSLFVLPIAVVGTNLLPATANPDLFVLTIPLAAGQDSIALLAFLGGFSSGTSMVIVSCIALSTMISNHILMPLALRTSLLPLGGGGDVQRFLLVTRRFAICFILATGFIYLWAGATSVALASIGLIAFAGVAQMLPALIAALYWPAANRRGALLGLTLGFAIWCFCLFFPGIFSDYAWWKQIEENGLFGLSALRPNSLFGSDGSDALMHATFWSLLFNIGALVVGSLSRKQERFERLQAALFVGALTAPAERARVSGREASADTLFDLAQRIMGPDRAYQLFRSHAASVGATTAFAEPDDAFISLLEQRLAASIGAASARVMIQRVTGSEWISLDELVEIAGETARLMRQNTEVERKSSEIEQAARQLSAANQRLQEIDRQKDEFLSQVSHELRTPMTSIRSFTEILTGTPDLSAEDQHRFTKIIHSESIRLTQLLDEILDMNVVEQAENALPTELINPEHALDQAIDSCLGLLKSANVTVQQERHAAQPRIRAQSSRVSQVFINIISNAIKYGAQENSLITIRSEIIDADYVVTITDNGPGISSEDRKKIFEKFTRGSSAGHQQGAGLGLAISRRITDKFAGSLDLLPSLPGQGAQFQVSLPLVSV